MDVELCGQITYNVYVCNGLKKLPYAILYIVRDRAPGPFYEDVGPNPREWVESCFLPLKMEVRLVIFFP